MYKFKFADIGEGLHEGKVGQIFKKVGDTVKEGENLFSVETDKVSTEIPSPVTGKITWMSFNEGQTIHVGEEIYHFDEETNSAKPIEEGASVVGEVKVSNETINLKSFSSQNTSNNHHVLSTPLARNLAAKIGVDINKVKGSGYNGRVLIHDIQNAQTDNTKISLKTTAPITEDKRIKVTSIRHAIAKAMTNSWNNVAYTNLTLEVNMTSLWNQRKLLTSDKYVQQFGTKITFLPFIMKATMLALKEYRTLNGSYDEKNDEIIQYGKTHMGIAVDTPSGLFVPVVRDLETKSIFDMNIEVQALAKKAREGKLVAKEMSGSTFTISNYGSTGALFGVPIINFPNIGLLGVGAIVDRVYAYESGSFYNGKAMYITVSADHRWVDGAEIGNFGAKIKELLENPILLGEL